jgi:aspartate aminotransferase
MTAEELKNAITPKTRAIVLNNPNNPTGSVYSEQEIRAIAEVLEPTDIAVISDEIYEMLNYTGKPIYSIAQYSEKMKSNTIIVNGVSKSYAMTGWRIGFTACETAVAKAISSMQSHMTSNPNTIAQYATISAYTDEAGEQFIAEMHESFDRRRKLICAELDKTGIPYIKPEGAFYVFLDISELIGKKYNGVAVESPLAFAKILLSDYDVAVIPCESFGNDVSIRLSYAISDADIVKGVTRIGQFVSTLK